MTETATETLNVFLYNTGRIKEDIYMVFSVKDYRNKVLGCWMGKNIGGTLGAPMEWKRQVNDVSFYTQVLDGNPFPNDDLDLQLVWLMALEEQGIDINARTLADYWLTYITPHWAEYGNSKANLRSGLMPPLSGIMNNPYKDSYGAFIRSEIWACIAPGCPDVAVKYAYEDAIVDHGNGEGMYAEIFCAALESAAFVESDPYKLIHLALSYIPEDCGIAKVVKLVLERYASKKPYLEVRDEILSKYRAHYTEYAGCSQEDVDKGFADGPLGWDAPANIGFLIIGWLYGEGDFGKSLCYTVNCGEDTDCTAATLGSIFGIIHGIDKIPKNWIDPIGNGIKTMCINMGEAQGKLPATIEELTERVERMARQVLLRWCPSVELSEVKPTEISDSERQKLLSKPDLRNLYRNLTGPVYEFDAFDIYVDYIEGPYVKNSNPVEVKITIVNKYRTQESLNMKWYVHDGWTVGPLDKGKLFMGTRSDLKQELKFTLTPTRTSDPVSRFVLELTADGRPTVMLVPMVLLSSMN